MPEFIDRLGHAYTRDQKDVIVDMLEYINDLEYEVATK